MDGGTTRCRLAHPVKGWVNLTDLVPLAGADHAPVGAAFSPRFFLRHAECQTTPPADTGGASPPIAPPPTAGNAPSNPTGGQPLVSFAHPTEFTTSPGRAGTRWR